MAPYTHIHTKATHTAILIAPYMYVHVHKTRFRLKFVKKKDCTVGVTFEHYSVIPVCACDCTMCYGSVVSSMATEKSVGSYQWVSLGLTVSLVRLTKSMTLASPDIADYTMYIQC